jgi:hypothetical protein
MDRRAAQLSACKAAPAAQGPRQILVAVAARHLLEQRQSPALQAATAALAERLPSQARPTPEAVAADHSAQPLAAAALEAAAAADPLRRWVPTVRPTLAVALAVVAAVRQPPGTTAGLAWW